MFILYLPTAKLFNMLSRLMFTTMYFYLHFTDKETKSQYAYVTCPSR